MNEYKNFSKNNNYISSYNNKIIPSNPNVAFSLKNISTAFNSYISNDLKASNNNNEKNEKIDFNELFKKNSNRLVFRTTNNYYRKKNYQKFLNLPQSGFSTFEDINNNSYFKKKTYNKMNFNINLNSNLENKTNIKLKVKELLEISNRRNKIIKEKKKLEELKREKLLEEEKKLCKILINTLCEDGVQTSSYKNILKDRKEDSILTESSRKNEIIFKDVENKNESNIKSNGEVDIVNIGNLTEETILNENSNKKIINFNNENNNNDEFSFIIENNDNISSSNNKNNEEDTLTFDNTLKNNSDKEGNCIDHKDENIPKISKVNKKSELENYDINKINIKNEIKPNLSDSLNNRKDDTDIVENKIKSVENIIYDNKENSSNNIKSFKKNSNLLNEINNNNKCNNSINNNKNNLKNIKNIFHRKNINSCKDRFNKKIVINRKIINMSKKIILSSNLKENSLNKNNNIIFRTDGFKRKNYSSINIKEKTNNNFSKNNKTNISSNKSNNNENKLFNKYKRKRQFDNYVDYYKLRNNSREKSFNKNNIG